MLWRSEREKEICEASIERWEKYIKEQLEEKKMNNNELDMKDVTPKEPEQRNPFDSIGGDYVKLDKDKAKFLVLTNWRIDRIKKFKDDKTGELKEQDEFVAEVVNEDGQPCSKTFTTTSYNAMKGLKNVFAKYWPDTARPVSIRIKKIGEGKATVYDIEEQKI